MSFSIRRFKKTDARAVASMLQKLAAFHGEKSLAKPEDFPRRALGANSLSHILIATSEQKPVGFIEYSYFVNYLRGLLAVKCNLLFVEESFRGQGIGKALILRLLKEADKKGCKRFDIGAETTNKLSNGLYKSLGLIGRKNNHFDYKADEKIIRKLLGKRQKN